MNQQKPTGPAQPNQVERPEKDSREASTKQPERQKPKDDEALPGADGFRSAGANEDTYD